MDAPLTPPNRILPTSTSPLSLKSTEKHIDAFLADFKDRSAASLGGNGAVTVQLQKLKEALREERKGKD